MDKIYVLQIGKEDWRMQYSLPEYVEYTYVDMFTQLERNLYDVVFVDRKLAMKEAEMLQKVMRAHTLFVTERVEISGKMQWLYDSRAGRRIWMDEIQEFLTNELKYYYSQSAGKRYSILNLALTSGFSGDIQWKGNHNLTLKGNFGDHMKQVAFWRDNLHIPKDQEIDLWLEYKKTPGVVISLEVTQFAPGSISEIVNHWKFSEADMEQIVTVDSKEGRGSVFVSVCAMGEGELQIIALHQRQSRGGHGHLLPGGKRYVTSEREELFSYLDPGDLRPPLNVYFSGYHTMEKFEGYRLMKQMDCPFLLLSENRLEGGGFYMGSREYERILIDTIRENMMKLGFSSEQVVFSGISMGACGAMYYGSHIRPHAMILGKPLLSLGDMAAREKRQRPGGFPASLDVLLSLSGDTDKEAIEKLNKRFWNQFRNANFSRTKLIVAYMIEDDFDGTAYDMILSNLNSDGVHVYGKGFHGRHNDDTRGIVNWLTEQYMRILSEDFERGKMW